MITAVLKPFFVCLIKGFGQHSDETDQDRIQQIILRAVEDSKWILNKVIIEHTFYLHNILRTHHEHHFLIEQYSQLKN